MLNMPIEEAKKEDIQRVIAQLNQTDYYQLKDKKSSFEYKIVYYRTTEEFEKFIKKLKREGQDVMPILMFLYEEKEK